MSNGISSHGALMAMEKDGDAAGTFTTISETHDFGNILGLTRNMTEITPHNDGISTHVPGHMVHQEWTFQIGLVFNDGTHDQTTGLQKRHFDGDKFGLRFRGPSGAASTHEIICSGHLTNLSRAYPVDGALMMDVSFQPSGEFIVDGTAFGNVGAVQA